MIAPLIPYAIKGAIWYQGESNAGRAELYRTGFPLMIQNWRDDWKQGDFPFLFVQLAPWGDDAVPKVHAAWPELWEGQLLTAKELPKVGMAVITDIGAVEMAHPLKEFLASVPRDHDRVSRCGDRDAVEALRHHLTLVDTWHVPGERLPSPG